MTVPALLHYVGSGLYSVEAFEAEATQHGVNRAMPERIVGTLSWGQSIYVARWVPDRDAERAWKEAHEPPEPVEGRAPFKHIGEAQVFGRFMVSGLNVTGPAEAKAELIKRLRVVGIVSEIPEKVDRRCGSYQVAARYSVEDSVRDIVEKGKGVEKEMGVKFKWFVNGTYLPVEQFTLPNAQYTRGVLWADVPDSLSVPVRWDGSGNPVVGLVDDYNRRVYVPKKDR